MQNEASSLSDRVAPPELWHIASAFLHTLHAIFGAPEEIAAHPMLTLRAHTRLASWLRCAEAFLRRLLMIEAAAHPKCTPRQRLPAPRERLRIWLSFEAAKPEEWRVSFRCLSSTDEAQSKRSVPKRNHPSRDDLWRTAWLEPPKLRSAWALAERFEALIRVFNDPAAYAKRLAARLHAKPERLKKAMRAPPEAQNRIDRFNFAGDCVETAWPAHFSSA